MRVLIAHITRRLFRTLPNAMLVGFLLAITGAVLGPAIVELFSRVTFQPVLNGPVFHGVSLNNHYVSVNPGDSVENMPEADAVVVSVVVSELQPESHTIHAAVQVALGSALAKRLVFLGDGTGIVDPTTGQILPKYASMQTAVVFSGYDPLDKISIPLSLQDLVAGSGETPVNEFPFSDVKEEIVDLPVTWQDQRYPLDMLYVDAGVFVELPSLIVTREAYACLQSAVAHCPPGVSDSLPPIKVQVRTRDASTTEGWAAQIHQLSAAALSDQTVMDLYQKIAPFALSFSRSSFTVWYTLGLAGVPCVLCLLLAHTLWLRRRAAISDVHLDSLQNFVLSLAATMLTVVPLRAVLVPSGISTLTTIDLILGCELLALLTVGVLQHGSVVLVRSWTGDDAAEIVVGDDHSSLSR